MSFTITSAGTVMFFGTAFLGWIAGNLGSLIGGIIAALRIPRIDGGRLYAVAGLTMFTVKRQPLKFALALVVAGTCMYLFPDCSVRLTMAVCSLFGAAVVLIVGQRAK